MRNLILFLIRYSTFLVFILLELISYALVVNYNSNQQKIFSYSSSVIIGSITEKSQEARNFFNLVEISDSLVNENADLKAQIFSLKDMINESSIEQLKVNYELIPARVSNNSISGRHNSFILNKGVNHGVEPGMGVINDNGVVGIIRHVSANYSTAISILNGNMRISSKIKGSEYFGILRWDGMNIKKFTLIDIPKYADIHVGDTIITSSYSSIFPEDIILGTIDNFQLKPGSNTFDISVLSSVHLEKMKFAYIVKNKNPSDKLKNEASPI